MTEQMFVAPTTTLLFGQRHLPDAMSPKNQEFVKYLARSQMATDDQALRAYTVTAHTKTMPPETGRDGWRRACGCIKTSDKLRQILMSFPTAPPPTPPTPMPHKIAPNTCISACCHGHDHTNLQYTQDSATNGDIEDIKKENQSWTVLAGLVSLVQLSVTATALVLYYLIYCYMQLVYYTLKTALYFHNADGPMKITIGVMTLTSLVVGFNMLLRMERLMGIWI